MPFFRRNCFENLWKFTCSNDCIQNLEYVRDKEFPAHCRQSTGFCFEIQGENVDGQMNVQIVSDLKFGHILYEKDCKGNIVLWVERE